MWRFQARGQKHRHQTDAQGNPALTIRRYRPTACMASRTKALETAFQRLLADTATAHGWTLIPKQNLKVAKKNIVPDGTMRDLFTARRGFWEAKDTDDDLDAEISKKIAKGYPTGNIIFEDTRVGVLFQGGKECYRFDLTKPEKLAACSTSFTPTLSRRLRASRKPWRSSRAGCRSWRRGWSIS